jgi:hypothetical protein
MDRLPARGRLLQNAFAERGETAGIVPRKGGKREPPGAVALGGSCQLVGRAGSLWIERLPDPYTLQTLVSFARAELTALPGRCCSERLMNKQLATTATCGIRARSDLVRVPFGPTIVTLFGIAHSRRV